jgi:hypothetical protein
MTINMAKSKEIVFRRPNPKLDVYLPSLPGMEQISEAKLLGVIFSNNFHINTRINFILKVCNQRSYLIRRLRDQGLSRKHLNIVFDAIILSRIMCASRSSRSWSGLISLELVGRIDAFFDEHLDDGFCQTQYSFLELCSTRDLTLFEQVLKSQNCIHQLLPAEKNVTVQQRSRGHNCILSLCKYDVYKNSFVNRCLYNYV